MKVTISFNGTKVVVPCGDGDLSVRELTTLAIARYKRAIGRHHVSDTYWVSVSSLVSHEGGMLDPDDLICDVCDDREQLQAVFEEQGSGHIGDGMSSDSDREARTVAEAAAEDNYQIRRAGENALQKVENAAAAGSPNLYRTYRNHFSGSTSSSSTLVPIETRAVNDFEDGHESDHHNHNQLDSLPDSYSFETKCSLNVLRRREPLGASAGNSKAASADKTVRIIVESEHSESVEQRHQAMRPCIEIVIPNEIGPLGIHVVPCTEDGRLVVQGIEPGGRVDRDGRLAVGDEILEINDYLLTSVPFGKAQEIFKEALFAKELKLKLIKGVSDIFTDPAAGDGNKENVDRNNRDMQQQTGSKVTAVQANNTRKIGRIIRISLRKGPSGLGFSITTRDNATGGQTPIYIKNIMPKGAAIEDGTLKSGDRLLEINSTSVDGMTQSQVVDLLRSAQPDSVIELVVSRQVSAGDEIPVPGTPHILHTPATPAAKSPSMSRSSRRSRSPGSISASTDNYESQEETSGNGFQFPWKQRQILTFDIPVHDSERAGLGVSVKGKTSNNSDGSVVDLGIFVKSVINGGAASRDGRLSTNDQLVNINGISLLGKPNPQAMETLRRAMHEEGPIPGVISLTVARRRASDAADGTGKTTDAAKTNAVEEGQGDSMSSSSDDIVREYTVTPHRFKAPPPPSLSNQQQTSLSSLRNTRNPVIDRLMGKESAGIVPSNIRNESYLRATHETWNGSMMPHHLMNQQPLVKPQPRAPVAVPAAENIVLIEQASLDESADASFSRSGSGFARDQPGRQSMSEKRHATLDAKSTDTYQKRKKARDERLRLQQMEHQRLRWKKSASMESLHAAVMQQERELEEGEQQLVLLTPDEREALRTSYVRASSVRVARSRGQNESFRQAVDRSYEKTMPGAIEGEDFEIEDDDQDAQLRERQHSAKKKTGGGSGRNSKLLRLFRIGASGSGSAAAQAEAKKKSSNRKSMPSIPPSATSSSLASAAASAATVSTSSMPISHSVPDYKTYSKSRSGGDLPTALGTSDFVRPYQRDATAAPPPSQVHYRSAKAPPPQLYQGDVYDHLSSAMNRPGSRVGIADPGANSTSSDYELIQRHLQLRNRNLVQQQPVYTQHQLHQHQNYADPEPVAWRRGDPHTRSQSSPSRVQQRPKSNFYEYETWQQHHMHFSQAAQQQQQQQQQQRGGPVRPAPPQKPSERAIAHHLSSMAATDPFLYGVIRPTHPPQQQRAFPHSLVQRPTPSPQFRGGLALPN